MADAGVRAVYLDNNSTTAMDPAVIEKVTEVMTQGWANPSSQHAPGLKAKQYLTEARLSVATMLNSDPDEIIFTSGGTESANTVLYSLAKVPHNGPKPHFVVSNVEHPCVGKLAQILQNEGKIDLTVVQVCAQTGCIVPDHVYSAIRPNTVLVAVMLANNETGIIMPIKQISTLVTKYRRAHGSALYPLLLSDAAQAVGKIPVDVRELGVDFLSLAGHKFHGPRCGALYVRGLAGKGGVPLEPLIIGAGHENGYRSGTENVCLIAGLGKAADVVRANVSEYTQHMEAVRDRLEAMLEKVFGHGIHFNGRHPEVPRLPNTSSVSVLGEKFHRISVRDKLKCSQVGTGAACHSTAIQPSASLLAAGVPEDIASNALRVSLDHTTSLGDIEIFVDDLKQAIAALEGAV